VGAALGTADDDEVGQVEPRIGRPWGHRGHADRSRPRQLTRPGMSRPPSSRAPPDGARTGTTTFAPQDRHGLPPC
jgi:hypothetical protein